MANVYGWEAPGYLAPADWTAHRVRVTVGGDPIDIPHTGLFVTDQTLMDGIAGAVTSATALIWLKVPPMGYTYDPNQQNPSPLYPTPALLAQFLSGAAGYVATPDPTVWKPSHNQLVASNFNPAHVVGGVLVPANYGAFNRVWVPAGASFSGVWFIVTVAGASVTSGYAAIYEADGTRVGMTASMTTDLQTAGVKYKALAAPVAAQNVGRFVWVMFTSAASTQPTLGYSGAASGYPAAGIPALTNYPAFYKATMNPPPASTSFTVGVGPYGLIWAGLA